MVINMVKWYFCVSHSEQMLVNWCEGEVSLNAVWC